MFGVAMVVDDGPKAMLPVKSLETVVSALPDASDCNSVKLDEVAFADVVTAVSNPTPVGLFELWL